MIMDFLMKHRCFTNHPAYELLYSEGILIIENTVRNWQFFLRHLSCVNMPNPPILIQDRWYVYEDTEKRRKSSGI